jgi:NADH-quinone oxidoreductase subunit J
VLSNEFGQLFYRSLFQYKQLMFETILFYTLSFFLILFALGVILSRSPIYSVLSLVGAMALMSGLFILLKAFLVATILILVYAGAILVLFLFVVMLVDFKKMTLGWEGLKFSPIFAILLAAGVFYQSFKIIRSIPQLQIPLSQASHGTAEPLGQILFHQYVLPFELTSFLLLAAVVSVVVLAKKDSA